MSVTDRGVFSVLVVCVMYLWFARDHVVCDVLPVCLCSWFTHARGVVVCLWSWCGRSTRDQFIFHYSN